MIISGGMNIYPQECENLLITHSKATDVAVFGVPNEDLGEEVKAVVQAAPGVLADAELAAELTAFCREHLAHIKCPRSIDFTEQLPRLPTGKLYKRELRDPYWADHSSKIARKCKRQAGERSAHPVDNAQNHRSTSKSGEPLGRPLAESARGRVRDHRSILNLTKYQI